MQLGARGGVTVLAAGLAACQVPPSDTGKEAITTAAAAATSARETPSSASRYTPIDWAGAGDCLDQLRLLHEAARSGGLERAHAPPFAVVSTIPKTSLEWVSAPTAPLIADLPLDFYEDQGAAAAAAPCVLRIEQPTDLRAAHRVVDFQNVASLYQSGVRSESNPDYDAARARVREAERESRSSRPGILRVGDPLLDLIGLLVGGVIATFDQIGSDDDLDESLAALKETPRSRDRLTYRAYEFERSTVRAGKEATIPVALHDLQRGGVWRAELRQREMRQFAIVEGLDPRDRDYEQHRAGAMSWEEFDHWQSEPPQLPLSALVAALVDPGAIDRAPPATDSQLVAATPMAPLAPGAPAPNEPEPDVGAPVLAALEPGAGPGTGSRLAAAGPGGAPAPWLEPERTWSPAPLPGIGQIGQTDASAGPTVLAVGLDPRAASLVRLETGSVRGVGFYVRPRLVATTADLVGSASVIDVITSDGDEVLGLVVQTDSARNLAVVHVPRSGRPTGLSSGPAPAPGQTVDVLELLGHDRARITPATLRPAAAGGDVARGAGGLEIDLAGTPAAIGAPIFVNERAVGLLAGQDSGSRRGIVPLDALTAMLQSEALAALR